MSKIILNNYSPNYDEMIDHGNNNNNSSSSTHFSVYDMHKNVCTEDYGGQCFIKLRMMMDEWQTHSSWPAHVS